nr:RNA-binding KH domain-containing protein PEPPER-like [Solanum lycopersicum]
MVYSTVTSSLFAPAIRASSSVPPPPPKSLAVKSDYVATGESVQKWPGWPGDNIFKLVVPIAKVGGIIGRRGEVVKRMCKETGATVRVLESSIGNADQIVLITGRENPDVEVSLAMDAAIRIFKCVAGLNNDDPGAVAAFPSRPASAAVSDYQDPYLLDHGTAVDSKTPRSTLPRYGQDIVTKHFALELESIEALESVEALCFCLTITKVMQVPLGYAEEIIGAEGCNIAYIRRTSGATLTEFIDNHQEPAPTMYGMGEPEFGSFSRYGDPYSSSSSFPP